ncbi:MAG: hypothetical protein K0V04_33520 [Deltaproteobacteria bacterium]|nr:hypothetical protein [Deltaproteobacteria bacterium]
MPEQIERDGQTYDLLGPVVEQAVEPGPDAVIRPRTEPVVLPEDIRPLDSWSREELADKLRPVIASAGGYVYAASEPNWKAADIVLEGSMESLMVDAVVREGEGRPLIEPARDEEFREIFGSDNRFRVFNTLASPFNGIVKLELYSGNTPRGHCTGSYIGPWTLITAAHCLVFSNTDRIDRIRFQPARNGGTLPNGTFDCRLDDASGSNDYLWSVPSGFFTGQAVELDYAVIDTWPCHSAPAWFGGYRTNAPSSTFSMYGYSGDTCPGAPSGQNYQCGMSGAGETVDWRMETQTIDGSDGQSGGPWWRSYDINRPVATHSGYIEYFDFFRCGFDNCKRNYGRRIDNAYNQFIIDVAWDY